MTKARSRGVKRGAFAALQKPVDQKSLNEAFANLQKFLERGIKSLLVIEDNEIERRNILDSIGHNDVRVTPAATAAEGLAALKSQRFDCVVLDLGLPDMPGLDLIESIRRDPALHNLPVIVYTGRDLTPGEQARVETLAESVITKDARSMDRLLSETAPVFASGREGPGAGGQRGRWTTSGSPARGSPTRRS